jgi:hypothetical protein
MKLVRDRIPELATTTGEPGTFHQAATEAEFALWLRAKLLEEAQEAVTASPATPSRGAGRRPPSPVRPGRAGRPDRG